MDNELKCPYCSVTRTTRVKLKNHIHAMHRDRGARRNRTTDETGH